MKFYCIADADTVRGFRLAGIAGQVVTTAPQESCAAVTSRRLYRPAVTCRRARVPPAVVPPAAALRTAP